MILSLSLGFCDVGECVERGLEANVLRKSIALGCLTVGMLLGFFPSLDESALSAAHLMAYHQG